MIEIIRKLFCKHEWQDVSGEVNVWKSVYDKYPCGFRRTYVCKKCLKKKTIKY